MEDDFTAQVSGVGALADPARRALYRYVVEQHGPVSRDAAAEGTGLPRHTAKFHLDRLVADGLLEVEFRRLSGAAVVLANCPFHTLARDHTALVCGMNLHLLTALLDTAAPAMTARLDPAPGRCCVVIGPE